MSTQGLDALAALCGNAASAAAANNKKSSASNSGNKNVNEGGDKAQGNSGGLTAAAPAQSSSVPVAVPSMNSGLPAFYQQQGQQQQHQQQLQQHFIQQQAAAGLQQAHAAAARQALTSMPPQLFQAYLSSQPGIGQALQSAFAGGQFAASAPPPTAPLTAAFPGLAASAEQQHQSQLQMIAAQVLAAQHQAASAAAENNVQSQSTAVNPSSVSTETSVASAPPAKHAAPSPTRKRAPTTTNAAAITMPSATSNSRPSSKTMIAEWEDKKFAKRAANRLSAHMSRKRKKMFVEDLKDENMELRRKEMILRSIPDLIVVFDSSGSMSFVSQSATRFLKYTSSELENTSFWDRLTEDSVRLIKSSFMDALAVKRKPDDDTTPLADGKPISVKIIDRDDEKGEGLPFSLKGVVHFAADSPECVCTLCPETTKAKPDMPHSNANQVSDGSQC